MEGEENGARMFKVFQVFFFLRLAEEAGIFWACAEDEKWDLEIYS